MVTGLLEYGGFLRLKLLSTIKFGELVFVETTKFPSRIDPSFVENSVGIAGTLLY